MERQRSPKKSETVEVRLSHPVKTAFMDRCRAEGRTASDAIRQFIEAELETSVRPRSTGATGWRALAAAAVAGLALGAVAAPSLAQSAAAPGHESDRARFERLDRDHDGVLSLDEYVCR